MEYVMNRVWKTICMALLLLGLNGCASMSNEECATGDWAAIGYEDGARGYTTERITDRRKACAKHGVTLDFAAYQSGREQGLVEYCQPGRGFSVGSNGGRYGGVCSVQLEPDFLEAYNAGYHLYTLRSNVNRATSAINSKDHEIDRIKEDMRLKEAALISAETTVEERVLLLVDLKDLSERIGQLDAEIQDLYEQRAHSQAELDNYQVALLDAGY
jgi:hypothetical protein